MQEVSFSNNIDAIRYIIGSVIFIVVIPLLVFYFRKSKQVIKVPLSEDSIKPVTIDYHLFQNAPNILKINSSRLISSLA